MIVITGATGNTGSVAARKLLAQGKRVRVVGRSLDRLLPFAEIGGETAVADVSDAEALAGAFDGAHVVYLVIPPNMRSEDFRAEQVRVADSFATALQRAGVSHAVALSSIGGDKPSGTGPVAGLHDMEQRLNAVAGLNVLHLRPAYFMENTLALAGIIKAMGVAAGPLRPDVAIPMIATKDIGEAAADALSNLAFTGSSTRELLGERDISMAECTGLIGKAIGTPELAYVQATDEQVMNALLGLGVSLNVAGLLIELSHALNSGHVTNLEPRSPVNTTPTSYEDFVADTFLPAYQSS